MSRAGAGVVADSVPEAVPAILGAAILKLPDAQVEDVTRALAQFIHETDDTSRGLPADWLNDGKVHSCNFDSAYAGFEIMAGMCRSVVEGGQVALPLTDGADEINALRENLVDKKLLFGSPEHKAEYPDA